MLLIVLSLLAPEGKTTEGEEKALTKETLSIPLTLKPITKPADTSAKDQATEQKAELKNETAEATVAVNTVKAEPAPEAATHKAPATKTHPLEAALEWHNLTVKNGDNLTTIFRRVKLGAKDVYEVDRAAKKNKLKVFKKMQPGDQLELALGENGRLEQLNYNHSALRTTEFTKTDKGFEVKEVERTPDRFTRFAQATIEDSLFLAGKEAKLTDSMIMELAGIFGWDVDFILDIRSGDSFSLMYEELFLDGNKIGNGDILSAEFINRGKRFRAVRYEDANGFSHYYTPEGRSMRKEFLRTPVDFARISSHFNLRRKHPILNTIRAHKGTDYAAPRGTPVRAAGDGKVTFASRKGGYGNTVIIQHGQTYKTLYAHLHKFHRSVRSGARVKQGQIIGYVGSTGLATGPHLHYEFYVNGSVRNPVRVKLPKAKSIPKQELAAFKAQTSPWVAQLDHHLDTYQVAANDSQEPKIH